MLVMLVAEFGRGLEAELCVPNVPACVGNIADTSATVASKKGVIARGSATSAANSLFLGGKADKVSLKHTWTSLISMNY